MGEETNVFVAICRRREFWFAPPTKTICSAVLATARRAAAQARLDSRRRWVMRRLVLAALFLLAGGCASVSQTTGGEGSGGRSYGIGHRPVQEIQPPPFEALVDTPPIACYSLTDKHEAFGGTAAYTPTSDERRLDDSKGGLMRRYTVPEPIAGNCQAPQLFKVVRLEAAIYWSPKTCAHV